MYRLALEFAGIVGAVDFYHAFCFEVGKLPLISKALLHGNQGVSKILTTQLEINGSPAQINIAIIQEKDVGLIQPVTKFIFDNYSSN